MIERFPFQKAVMRQIVESRFQTAANCSRALAVHPQQVHMIIRGVSGAPSKMISRLNSLGMTEDAQKLLDAKIKDFISYSEFETEIRSREFSGWGGNKSEG